jgi:hypothetical protein
MRLGLPLTGELSDANLQRIEQVLMGRGHGDGAKRAQLRARRAPEKPPVTVSGVLRTCNKRAGITIEVLKATLGGASSEAKKVTKTKTTADGTFHVAVSVPEGTPIRLRFKDGDRDRVTPPKLAAEDTWIECGDADAPAALPGKFEVQNAVLQARLGGKSLNTLNDTDECPDVALLSELTGVPAADTAAHVVAAKLAKELEIPTEAAYALSRRAAFNAPTRPTVSIATARMDLDQTTKDARVGILQCDASCIESDIERAIASGEISENVREKLHEIKGKLEDKHLDFLLDQPFRGGSSWRKLLRAAGVEEVQVKDAAKRLGTVPDESKWQSAADLLGEAQVERLRTAMRLAEIVGPDAPTVQALLTLLDSQKRDAAPVKDPVRRLCALTEKELHDALKAEGVAEEEARAAALRIDQSFPGDVLLRRIGDAKVSRAGAHASAADHAPEAFLSNQAKKFLERHPDLDLRTARIEQELANDAEACKEPSIALKIAKELLPLQRMVRIARNGRDAEALLLGEFDSAQALAFTSVATISTRTGLDKARAREIHARARAHYRATLSLYLNHSKHANRPGLPIPREATRAVARRSLRRDDARTKLLSSFPSYEALFGPQPDCLCEDWDSVTSPAAYLVDLLLWLKVAESEAPYNELKRRRPDLELILLDQPNTETEIPYIDLACELLEDEVQLRRGELKPEDRPAKSRKRQTRGSSEAIRAYPEHVNQEVYDFLKTCSEAMSLPFDLPLAEVRAYLGKWGVSHLEVVKAYLAEGLSAPTGFATVEAAAEYWGLNQAEFLLITKPDPGRQESIWSFNPDTEKLVPVETILDRGLNPKRARAALDYDTLQTALDGEFVDPARATQPRLKPGLTVDTGKLAERYVGDWTKESLDRLHRLLRLSKHTAQQWSLAETDLLVSALGSPTNTGAGAVTVELDEPCLTRLAMAAELCKSLSLGAEEIAYFFRSFPEALTDGRTPQALSTFDGKPSLYARLFLPPNDRSVPEIYRSPKEALGRKVLLTESSERPRLCAALGLTERDLRLLLRLELTEEEKNLLKDVPQLQWQHIGPASLAELYRHARLAKALNLELLDLLPLFQPVSGGSPFSTIEKLTAFASLVSGATTAGLSREDLALFVGAPSAPNPPDSKAVENDLNNLASSSSGAADRWVGALATWLKLDARYTPVFTALDKATRGKLAKDLLAPATRIEALHLAWRAARFSAALHLSADDFAAVLVLPGIVPLLEKPSTDDLRSALGFVAIARKSTRVGDLAAFFTKVLEKKVASMTSDELKAGQQELAGDLASCLNIDPAVVRAAWSDTKAPEVKQFVAALQTPEHFSLLLERARLASTLGVTHETLASWARAWPDTDKAAQVRSAVRGRFRESWLTVSATIQDSLRPLKRDALVAYLLANAKIDGHPRTIGDLYGQLLIDVEMEAVKTTSRIMQANAAIQLFVQRCFLGLEEVFSPDWKDKDYWQQWNTWRKRYRLWEANRLVFLYPENYLNSARRSTASPLFRDFLKRIRQDGSLVAQADSGAAGSQAIDESVSAALESYLSGLEEISNLDCAAVATDGNELGLIGRTRGTAPRHYYRTLKGGIWTAWEEVAIGEASSHIDLVQDNGRALLVWPIFADYPDPTQTLPTAEEVEANKQPPSAGALTYIRFAWTTRVRSEWSPIRTTSRALLYQRRAARSVLVNALVPSDEEIPGSFGVGVYVPSGEGCALLGQMNIARDTISSWALDSTMQLKLPAPIDNNPDLQTHRYELKHIKVDPKNVSSEWRPWDEMTFDNNRQTQGARRGTIKVYLNQASITALDLLTPPVAVAATVEPWGRKNQPKSDVFAVTSSYWSFLAVCRICSDSLEGQPSKLHKDLLNIDIDSDLSGEGKYTLIALYHPFASELHQWAKMYGIAKLFEPSTQSDPSLMGREAKPFVDLWGLKPACVPLVPEEAIEFESAAAYGLYNWEVFFHAPMVLADQLRAGQKFMEAQRYLHFIFNPMTTEKPDLERPRARYWVTKAFRQRKKLEEDEDISKILVAAAEKKDNVYKPITDHPFDADAIAQGRHTAYQKHVVMRYLDNVIAWGDSLFRVGEAEDINESLQHYMLADTLLGDRPRRVPPLRSHRPYAFDGIDWTGGGNALVALENLVEDAGDDEPAGEPLVHLPVLADEGSTTLYFRIPPNAKLLEYWDTVAQRLDNIRNSRTIDGKYQKVPLLSAKIDPAVLADAVAAGISVADAIAMAAAKPPPYRFRTMLAKAQEYCGEVKALGSALLAALEKRDAEQLARLRSQHEGSLLGTMRKVKEVQREQILREIEALEQQQETVRGRLQYYESRRFMNDWEQAAFGMSIAAAALDTTGLVFDVLGGVLYLIPNVHLGVSGFGGTPQAVAQMGGENLGSSARQSSQGLSKLAGILDRAAGMALTRGGYQRRQEEWDHQAAQARLELSQLEKQIIAARLRTSVADAELASQDAQERSWQKADQVLREKFSNAELYPWMA